MNIFLDSDVVISSFLSDRGAASLIYNQKNIKLFISSVSLEEIEIVVDRLKINPKKMKKLIEKHLQVVPLKKSLKQISSSFGNYVTDPNDAHIVAAAMEAKAKFLISYNLRHFKVDVIKNSLNITILTPGRFIQYLRSL